LDFVVLLLAGSATALATGLGAIPVFLLGEKRSQELRPAMWGFAAGTMAVASVVGLLLPAADEGTAAELVAGAALGIAFMLSVRRFLDRHQLRVAGMDAVQVRTSALVFLVLLVHSAPEGLAIGTAYASDTAGLGLFVILAIALQNVPEGTSTAIPMAAAGFSRKQQFWAAVLTSAPQPVLAVVAFVLVEKVASLLPLSFAFAAGAMLALVAFELLPQAFAGRRAAGALLGIGLGASVMLALAAVLGV
jgi:zinc transporter, ZIP family